MLKSYGVNVDVAPVKITWREEVVEDEDAGDFYVKLTPTVDWDREKLMRGEKVSDKPSPQILAVQARQRIAEQNRRIVADFKKAAAADIQMKLRAQYNKRHGQRWNKKV